MLTGCTIGDWIHTFYLNSSATSNRAELPKHTEHFHSQIGSQGGVHVQQEFLALFSVLQNYNLVPLMHLYFTGENKYTFSIFLFAVFLPHSLLSCSLIACSSLPKWIILSMAAWLPPHNWRLNWLESTSVTKTSILLHY